MKSLDKALEIFGDDMGAKYSCLFKAWARVHFGESHHKSFEGSDPYDIIEDYLFYVYPGFEELVDEFILKWVNQNSSSDEIDLVEITKDFLPKLGVMKCLLV